MRLRGENGQSGAMARCGLSGKEGVCPVIRIKPAVVFVWMTALSLFWIPRLYSQTGETDIEALKKLAPKIYIDCRRCDIDYIRTEIIYVNYVRDRKEAHVHVLITTQSTGGGGEEYTLAFLGQNEFEGENDVIRYYTQKTDTADEIRKGLVRSLKMGLMRYVAKTPIAERVNITYQQAIGPTAAKDKWNFWVFSLSANGFFMGEKSYNDRMLFGSFSANRVTPEWKIRAALSLMDTKRVFNFGTQEIVHKSDSQSFSGMMVRSLDERWSVGAIVSAFSATYNNYDFNVNLAPAVEFNLFPYSQSTRRQLRFLYRAGLSAVKYREETIYHKTSENLWSEALTATLELREKWGTVSTSLGGSHYFHDFSKNRLDLSGANSSRRRITIISRSGSAILSARSSPTSSTRASERAAGGSP